MNSHAQSSLEFLIIIVVVLALLVLIYANLPKDTSEITVLGITKDKLDEFILKTNYIGSYALDISSKDKDLNILVNFSNKNYDDAILVDYNKILVYSIKNSSNFDNIYISYN